MQLLLLANNASTTLASDIDASQTTITVVSVLRFPVIAGGSGDWFYATIADTTETAWEVVRVTATSGADWTVERGQDDTAGAAWSAAGSTISCRPNVQNIRDVQVTASDGVTLAAGNLTNDLTTGVPGGQTAVGGTGASENLTLISTSNATKGRVRILGNFSAGDLDLIGNKTFIQVIDSTKSIEFNNTGQITFGDGQVEGNGTSILINDDTQSIGLTAADTTILSGLLTLGSGIGLRPNADGTTAIQIRKADGTTSIATVDTTNSRVGIGTSTPVTDLDVAATNTQPVLTLKRIDTTIAAGDSIGKIQFYAKDDSTTSNFIVADIECQANNLITTDINPGRLIFRTTPATVAATPIERMRIQHTGLVGIATDDPLGQLDVSSGTIALAIGADASATTRTDATNKYARFGGAHYTNAEEPVAITNTVSSSTQNLLQFGGGAANMNTATDILFFTAANTVTLSGTERMRIDSSGNVGIGTTPNANAILDVTSTTKAFMPPRMTTAQRDAIASPAAGMVVYNTTTNVLNFHNGSAWGAV